MSKDTINIEITGREAKLILKYGYPFPDQAELIKPYAGKAGYHTIAIGKYWLEIIIGDLCRSIKEVKSRSLIDELDELCDVLETAISSSQRTMTLIE